MDPAMSIAMQHRAPQACNSCRRLKRKCVFNAISGTCNRCFETGRPCVYAEVNPAAPHADPDAVAHHSTPTTTTYAVPSGDLNTPPQQGNPMYLPFDVSSDSDWFFSYTDQQNALSNGSHVAVMGPGNGDIGPSSHAGGQN